MSTAAAAATTARNVTSSRGKEVFLSRLPTTVTVNDIKALTYRTPKPGLEPGMGKTISSVPRDSSAASLAAGISSVQFVRSIALNKQGQALVKFRDRSMAQEFARTADGKLVGGNEIRAEYNLAKLPHRYSLSLKFLAALQERSGGRIVMLRGLPPEIPARTVLKILKRSYTLAEDTITLEGEGGEEEGQQQQQQQQIGAVVKVNDASILSTHHSTFLVRLQTVADAMLLVSRWHQTLFVQREDLKERSREKYSNLFRRSAGEEEEVVDTDEEEFDEDPVGEKDRRDGGSWRNRLRNQMGQENSVKDLIDYRPQYTIDASIIPEPMVYISTPKKTPETKAQSPRSSGLLNDSDQLRQQQSTSDHHRPRRSSQQMPLDRGRNDRGRDHPRRPSIYRTDQDQHYRRREF